MTLIRKSFKLTLQMEIMKKSFKQTMSRAGARLLLAATMMTLLSAQAADPSKPSDNKATVVAFYEKALNDKDADAAIAMMGPTYMQHNSIAPDGKEGFRQFIGAFKQRYPASRSKIVRVFAEGDYVILHVHLVLEPGTAGNAVMDIFRLADGKIVEHWDVVQPIPEKIPHANTMF
jgi:predicted SnoaL-like aldol condensation-catalyzing enzyme